MKNPLITALLFVLCTLFTMGAYVTLAQSGRARQIEWTPVPVVNDPLVRMPGSQTGQVTNLESPNRCLNCHAGYDSQTEPGLWQGSMMAHAARDFLFWPSLAVAAQDSIYAVGNPNATDICIRCHMPMGWLAGRSDPTNASAMSGADFDGVQCDFCHRMVDPFFETTYNGTREGSDWLNYWDESGTVPGPAATTTYQQDQAFATTLTLFNGQPFYNGNVPTSTLYVESGGGQYFVTTDDSKRAPFADVSPNHGFYYSRFHKSKYFCNACHDVSNPVLANLGADPAQALPSEINPASSYFHVERTFSEFMLSDYGQQGGAPGRGLFATGVFTTSHTSGNIATCQDCHMRDVVGKGADKNNAVLRPTDSTSHPLSGVPQHDLTGGNIWVSQVLASSVSGSPNYDATNDFLLNQGSAVLTVDMSAGEGIAAQALLDGADRARWMLEAAAEINQVQYDAVTGELSFQVQNNTGHKLISGYPEGRRMFVNVRAYASGALIYEVNPYDETAATLKGLTYPYTTTLPVPAALTAQEAYVDALVYEAHPSSSITGESHTFHIALSDGREKDNRIPPLGFRINEAAARLSHPVWAGGTITDTYFTTAEYAGGYDAVALTNYAIAIPGADSIEINLFYQTTSREYVEFLRSEINGTGNTLPASAYVIQSDPFFDQLRAWGDTLWQVWLHTRDWEGAAPVTMTQSIWIDPAGLAIQASGYDAFLSWPYSPLSCTYEVIRATNPYFALPDGTLLTSPALPPGTAAYTDPNALGDPAINYFYRLSTCGILTDPVGEFDYALVPGQ